MVVGNAEGGELYPRRGWDWWGRRGRRRGAEQRKKVRRAGVFWWVW